MTEPAEVHRAAPDDAPVCAAIKNAWIDATGWMPRVHTRDSVEAHYRDVVYADREVYVTGAPADAYLALSEDHFVTSLSCAEPGSGRGKTLLDYAKGLRPRLALWTFVANTGARRFYLREGFRQVERSDGDNEEGLPDILFAWDSRGTVT